MSYSVTGSLLYSGTFESPISPGYMFVHFPVKEIDTELSCSGSHNQQMINSQSNPDILTSSLVFSSLFSSFGDSIKFVGRVEETHKSLQYVSVPTLLLTDLLYPCIPHVPVCFFRLKGPSYIVAFAFSFLCLCSPPQI